MKRLGSLSLGQLTALCTLCGIGFVLFVRGQEMFSPAPLNERSRGSEPIGGMRSHADIASKCAACHASPWGGDTMATRCLDCHTEVRNEISTGLKMHGQVSDGTDCRTCHTEHKGPHGAITSFVGFNHDRTDYKLTGKHHAVATESCVTCHKNEVYKGTATNCASCHAEPASHKERFGNNCVQCHTTHTWDAGVKKQGSVVLLTSFPGFHHDATGFKLTGKHVTTACMSCHAEQVLTGMVSHACATCHNEPASHQGRFDNNCTKCHTTNTWDTGFKKNGTKALLTSLPGFNHNTTAFKLTGKHLTTACMSCHAEQVLTGMVSHACATCHNEPPSHKGRFGTNCSQCHTTNTWDTANFTHRFPVNHRAGGNKTNACAKCHNDTNNFVSYTCYNCHTHSPERVAKQHSRRTIAQIDQCAKCHSTGRSGGPRKAGAETESIDVCLACPDVSASRSPGFLHGGVPKTVPVLPPPRMAPTAEALLNFLRFPMISKLPGSRL